MMNSSWKLIVCLLVEIFNQNAVQSNTAMKMKFDGSVNNTGSITLNLGASREDSVWLATGRNGSEVDIRIPASVPGGIYSDLEAAGLFTTQIYSHYNDRETKWVGRTDWTFTRTFNVTPELYSKSKILLVCEGLDTIATVYINNLRVGQSTNMFVRYEWNIKNFVVIGNTNQIRIEFKSPVLYAFNQQVEHNNTYGYPILPNELVPEYQGENLAQMIRKVQASFSWDWGPSYPSSGIWKNIYLQGVDSAVIRDMLVFLHPDHPIPDSNTSWTIEAKVYFSTGSLSAGTLILELGTESVAIPVEPTNANEPITISSSITGVDLWWPNGYGSQPLYEYAIHYRSSNTDNQQEISSKKFRIGFRTIELIEDLIDESKPELGREFYFLINGNRKMYSKGSNSIPIHVLPEKVTNEMMEWLLISAKETHSNVIRVWGGGIYYEDYWYDKADELGILIWQDFMFACAMYPATPEFLTTVKEEVESQVKRLQHHTSLAIWATNNENEGALRDNWYNTNYSGIDSFQKYKADYIKLYIDTVLDTTLILDPSRKCLPSSPTNGIRSKEEGWISLWPGDWIYGDTHPYDYYNNSWDWTIFRKTRYASEFGYQSFPHLTLLDKVYAPEDKHWNSTMMFHRQHHPLGQTEIPNLIKMHLPLPENYNSTEFFSTMLYLSQVEQSVSQKTQAESYRRLSDKFNTTTGYGHNMGALYWQLNDIWPGCSWASIQIDGRWKMLHYYAKKFLAPILPSAYISNDDDEDLIVELISDSIEPFSGSLNVQLFKLNEFNAVLSETIDVEADPLTSKEVYRLTKSSIDSYCGSNGPNGTQTTACFVYLTMDGVPDNFLFLNYPKRPEYLANPNLAVADIQLLPDGKTFEIHLTSEAIAPFVFLNLLNHTYGWFSDNGFIQTTTTKIVTYHSYETGLSLPEFRDQLEVLSLYDVVRFFN